MKRFSETGSRAAFVIGPWLFALVLILAAMLGTSEARAEDGGRFVHALSADDLVRLGAEMEGRWLIKPGTVFCNTRVRKSGRLNDTACFLRTEEDRILSEAVSWGARKFKGRPAEVDGRKQEVRIQFSVTYSDDAEPPFKVSLHGGTEAARLGEDYVGPQRIGNSRALKWVDNYKNCRRVPGRIQTCFIGDVDVSQAGAVILLDVNVEADGTPSACRLRYTGGETDVALEDCQKMRFIPGFVSGQPAAMQLTEPVFTR